LLTRSGELKEFGTGAKFENARFLASLLLDTVNVALAFGVARDADPGLASYLAGSSAAAHTLNLLSALGQEYAKTVLKDKSARTAARVFFGVRGAGSAVFAAKNLHDMWRAFEKGDRDNAIALALASAAEAASAVGYLISAFAATSAAGPWIAAVATLVAAGAYIAAELLSDDELATFLSHSKWGSRPYADPELLPKWAIAPVSAWQGDYAAQRRLLFKLLTRFSVAWASHGICAMGIEVNLAVVTRDRRSEGVVRRSPRRRGHIGGTGLSCGRASPTLPRYDQRAATRYAPFRRTAGPDRRGDVSVAPGRAAGSCRVHASGGRRGPARPRCLEPGG